MRELVHDEYNVSDVCVRCVCDPLAAVLNGGQILAGPSLPEAIREELYVAPSTLILVIRGADDWWRCTGAPKRQQMRGRKWLIVVLVAGDLCDRAAVDNGFYFA